MDLKATPGSNRISNRLELTEVKRERQMPRIATLVKLKGKELAEWSNSDPSYI